MNVCVWVYKYVSESFCRAAKCSLKWNDKNDNILFQKYLKLWRGVDKSDSDDWFATHPSECYLDGLKKLEQQNKKCVELRGVYEGVSESL